MCLPIGCTTDVCVCWKNQWNSSTKEHFIFENDNKFVSVWSTYCSRAYVSPRGRGRYRLASSRFASSQHSKPRYRTDISSAISLKKHQTTDRKQRKKHEKISAIFIWFDAVAFSSEKTGSFNSMLAFGSGCLCENCRKFIAVRQRDAASSRTVVSQFAEECLMGRSFQDAFRVCFLLFVVVFGRWYFLDSKSNFILLLLFAESAIY